MKRTVALLGCGAVLVAAVALYQWRVREMTRSFGGIPMPDVAESRAEWTARQLQKQIRTNEVRLAQLKREADEMERAIKLNHDLFRALGGTNSKTRPEDSPAVQEATFSFRTNLGRLRGDIAACEIQIEACKKLHP